MEKILLTAKFMLSTPLVDAFVQYGIKLLATVIAAIVGINLGKMLRKNKDNKNKTEI